MFKVDNIIPLWRVVISNMGIEIEVGDAVDNVLWGYKF